MTSFPENRRGEILVGSTPAIRQIHEQLQKASLTDVPVLITGESGTGKSLAAKMLHCLSMRRNNRFFVLSCPAMLDHILDCEPFGSPFRTGLEYVEGERISANLSEGGTLFLDEIAELGLAMQGKLLHELQDFRFVGTDGGRDQEINVRLICSTNRDLEAEVAKGIFRADLYYRVNVLRIQMPPLRECMRDVPVLMEHFLRTYSQRFGRPYIPLTPSLQRSFETYDWPGNTRELENMAKRYVVMGSEEGVLSMIRSNGERRTSSEEVDLTTPLRVQTKRAIQRLESRIILNVLKAHNWNRRKTAQSLDISYRTLLYKIKESGLPRSERAASSSP